VPATSSFSAGFFIEDVNNRR